jgi:hypothetical protein
MRLTWFQNARFINAELKLRSLHPKDIHKRSGSFVIAVMMNSWIV